MFKFFKTVCAPILNGLHLYFGWMGKHSVCLQYIGGHSQRKTQKDNISPGMSTHLQYTTNFSGNTGFYYPVIMNENILRDTLYTINRNEISPS